MNAILTGLNTLAAILGYNNYDSFDFVKEDFIKVLETLHVQMICKEDESYVLENQKALKDLYTLEGKNKYELIEFDSFYIIYDKENDSIVERKDGASPYQKLEGVLLIFVPSEITKNESLYLYANEKSVYDVQKDTSVDNGYINTITNNNTEEPGEYYLFDSYGTDHLRSIDKAFYFEHLRGRHGKNENGTCGVVASQVLLGYYDSFFDDSIIPETYDITTTFDNDITSYNVQSPGSGEDFHQYLINYLSTIGITNNGQGMNIYEEKDLICKYLRSRGFDFHERWVEGNWGDAISNTASDTIRNTIEDNRPIFVGARGHATVAYACDDKYIYVYDGWGDVRRTVWATTDTSMFNTNRNPHTVDISGWKSKHSHSNNYYSTLTNMYHCTCGYMWK